MASGWKNSKLMHWNSEHQSFLFLLYTAIERVNFSTCESDMINMNAISSLNFSTALFFFQLYAFTLYGANWFTMCCCFFNPNSCFSSFAINWTISLLISGYFFSFVQKVKKFSLAGQSHAAEVPKSKENRWVSLVVPTVEFLLHFSPCDWFCCHIMSVSWGVLVGLLPPKGK